MSYHYMATEKKYKDENLKDEFSGEKLPRESMVCFSGFGTKVEGEILFRTGETPLLGLILHRKVRKLFLDFNDCFNNIKIRVILQKRFPLYTNHVGVVLNYFMTGDTSSGRWNHFGHLPDGSRIPQKKLIKESNLYIMKLRFSPEYTNATRFHMYVPIMQFFRLFSPMSDYDCHFYLAYNSDSTVSSILNAWSHYSEVTSYGNWCSSKPSMEKFMKMDNPDFMNSACHSMGKLAYYGTELFSAIESKMSDDHWKESRAVAKEMRKE
jgi:hypothetical protein